MTEGIKASFYQLDFAHNYGSLRWSAAWWSLIVNKILCTVNIMGYADSCTSSRYGCRKVCIIINCVNSVSHMQQLMTSGFCGRYMSSITITCQLASNTVTKPYLARDKLLPHQTCCAQKAYHWHVAKHEVSSSCQNAVAQLRIPSFGSQQTAYILLESDRRTASWHNT